MRKTTQLPRGQARSYRIRISITIAAIYALAFLAISVLTWRAASAMVIDNLITRLEETAQARALAIDRYIGRFNAVARSYARVIERTMLEDDIISATLFSAFNEEDGISAIYYGGADGRLVTDLDWQAPEGFDPRQRLWYQSAVAADGRTAYSGVYIDNISLQPVISFSTAIFDSSGSLRGVLGLDLQTADIYAALGLQAFGLSGNSYLLDDSYSFILHPLPDLIGSSLEACPDLREIQTPLYDPMHSVADLAENLDRIAVWTRLPETRWLLILTLPYAEISQDLDELGWTYSLVFLASLGVVLATAWFLSKRMSAYTDWLAKILDEKNALLHTKIEEIQQLSITDSLTGLPNRRCLDERLQQEIQRWRRHGRSLAIIMFDIDHFKSINDRLGHQGGDNALTMIADIVTGAIRETDTAGRWGGEEFLVICPGTDALGVATLAEKLRANLEENSRGQGLALTASFGWSVAQAEDSPSRLVSRADKGLYQAKQAGRNCVKTVDT